MGRVLTTTSHGQEEKARKDFIELWFILNSETPPSSPTASMSTTPQQTALGFAYPVTPDNQQTQPNAAPVPSSSSSQPQSRQAAEEARKDRTLAEFMVMLDDYEPLVYIYYAPWGMITQCYYIRFPTKLQIITYSAWVLNVKMLGCGSKVSRLGEHS